MNIVCPITGKRMISIKKRVLIHIQNQAGASSHPKNIYTYTTSSHSSSPPAPSSAEAIAIMGHPLFLQMDFPEQYHYTPSPFPHLVLIPLHYHHPHHPRHYHYRHPQT